MKYKFRIRAGASYSILVLVVHVKLRNSVSDLIEMIQYLRNVGYVTLFYIGYHEKYSVR